MAVNLHNKEEVNANGKKTITIILPIFIQSSDIAIKSASNIWFIIRIQWSFSYFLTVR